MLEIILLLLMKTSLTECGTLKVQDNYVKLATIKLTVQYNGIKINLFNNKQTLVQYGKSRPSVWENI